MSLGNIIDDISFRFRFNEVSDFADSSFDINNNVISRGKEQTRFALSCLKDQPDAKQFNIAGKVITQSNVFHQIYRCLSKFFGYNVEVKISDEKCILFNINSLSTRLHIERATIVDAASKGEFETLLRENTEEERINSLRSKISKQHLLAQKKPDHEVPHPGSLEGKVDHHYKAVKNGFDLVGDEFICRDTGVRTGIKETDLKAALYEAYSSEGADKAIRATSYKFWKDENGDPAYLVHNLGTGSYGKVYYFVALKEPFSAGVFKVARRKAAEHILMFAPEPEKVELSFAEQAVKMIENEYSILKKVSEQGRCWGIQELPHTCGEITVRQKNWREGCPLKKKFGIVELRYNRGDYSQYIQSKPLKDVPIEARLMEFHQLLAGGARLAKLNILHGDLKGANLLCDDSTGFMLVHIADLGTACDANQFSGPLTDLVSGSEVRPTTFLYNNEVDLDRSDALVVSAAKSDLIENEKKRDVFAMGVLFYAALTGNYPFLCGIDGLSVVYENNTRTSSYIPISKAKEACLAIPDELEALIIKMVEGDAEKRISFEAAFDLLDELIKRDYPDTYDQIQGYKNDHGYTNPLVAEEVSEDDNIIAVVED